MELRDHLADTHGLALTKLDVDKFVIRCGTETFKINQKKAASLNEVHALLDALAIRSISAERKGSKNVRLSH